MRVVGRQSRGLVRQRAEATSRIPLGAFGMFAALGACVAGVERTARADEPISAREPRLLQETGENTTVIDAFDKGDLFDVNLLLTFRQSWKAVNIRRETSLTQGALSSGGFVSSRENIATYRQSTTTLEIGADVGLFRDLALSFRLPLVLGDTRELGDLDGSSRNPERLQDPAGDQLFTVPFKSPTRSGLDWFGVALNYAILNQVRDSASPTWVVGLETSFGIGPRLHACNDNAPTKCPDPANPSGPSRDAGMSRGMTMLALHTIVARRFGYLEPYVGMRAQMELPQSNSDFAATSDARGTLRSLPPAVGSVTIGTEVFPYENREGFQRVGLDFKLRGTYHSPGREYSELFDALGSSQARSLREANPGAYHASSDGSLTSVADPNAAKVFFTGITDQQAYGSFGGAMAVTWQAGEYVKFAGGLGLTYAQSHLITGANACNPDLGKGDAGAAGPCRAGATSAGGGSVAGIPNPNHRPVIDLPGRRFSADDTTVVDLWVSGVVMF